MAQGKKRSPARSARGGSRSSSSRSTKRAQRVSPHKGDARFVTRDRQGRITSNRRVDASKPTKSTRNTGESWSTKEIKELSSLAKQNTPTRVISLKLGRSVPSIRAKARSSRISLMPPNRSPYNRRASSASSSRRSTRR